jgi:hypothetical protein
MLFNRPLKRIAALHYAFGRECIEQSSYGTLNSALFLCGGGRAPPATGDDF